MNYDVFMVGVGGQGLLTIGKILAETAYEQGVPVSFFPNKGMAQRGGFVKAQLRLGRADASPNIPEGMADLVIAEELSESLKAVRYIRSGGDFVLSGEVWSPTAVMLGKASYPTVETVQQQIMAHGATLHFIDPKSYPVYQGELAPVNLFILGRTIKQTALRQIISPEAIEATIKQQWKHGLAAALFAYHAGLDTIVER